MWLTANEGKATSKPKPISTAPKTTRRQSATKHIPPCWTECNFFPLKRCQQIHGGYCAEIENYRRSCDLSLTPTFRSCHYPHLPTWRAGLFPARGGIFIEPSHAADQESRRDDIDALSQ